MEKRPEITLRLPAFLAKTHKLPSIDVEITEVYGETEKAFKVLVTGVFDPSEERITCWRCSKPITNVKSQKWGLGPDCATKLDIPWEQDPDLSKVFIKDRTTAIFLPKSFLTEEQILELKAYVKKTEGTVVQEARLWLDKNKLHLKAPFVSKELVADLKEIPGWDWNFNEKVTIFPAFPNTVGAVCEAIVQYNLLAVMDSDIRDMFSEFKKSQKVLDNTLEDAGVSSIAGLKEAEINVHEYNWGLNKLPWGHQARAILFTLAIFGLELPKKEFPDANKEK